MKSIVILISGKGSNMQAIVRASREENWPARVTAVISSRADAPGLAFARGEGIATAVVAAADYSERDAFDAQLQSEIERFAPDLVVLAGFLRILSAAFVARFAGRMLNIHPSLLPAFPGLHTHRRALEAGVRVHGATVHFVSDVLDGGPIVAQGVVSVHALDTEESLRERVIALEHRLLPLAVGWFVNDRIRIENDRVIVSETEALVLSSEKWMEAGS